MKVLQPTSPEQFNANLIYAINNNFLPRTWNDFSDCIGHVGMVQGNVQDQEGNVSPDEWWVCFSGWAGGFGFPSSCLDVVVYYSMPITHEFVTFKY